MNITLIVKRNLCTGCGTCIGICPERAIYQKLDSQKGIYYPSVDSEKCIQCGYCYEVCPGQFVNFRNLNSIFTTKKKYNETIGNYLSCFFGHSNNKKIRFNSSSGGVVTQLLLFIIKKKLVDFVVITKLDKENPFIPKIIMTNKEKEIIEASGSKYCPVPSNILIKNIINNEGKYAIVGLPCHIHGIRKAMKKNKILRDRIIFTFGIFCANTVTFKGTDFFLKKHSIEKSIINKFEYRGNGWPGFISIEKNNGEVLKFSRNPKKISNRILKSSAFHYDFTPTRCFLCKDQTAELADISFGDAWHKDFRKETQGKSLIITRNQTGENLILNAKTDNEIEIKEIGLDKVLDSQNYNYKNNYNSRIQLMIFLGKSVPMYYIKNKKANISAICNTVFYLPSYFVSKKYFKIIQYFIIALREFYKNSKIFVNKLIR